MSKGNINISVTGGHSDFGSVTIGDKNQISVAQHKEHLANFFEEVVRLSASNRAAQEQLNSLRKEIQELTEKPREVSLGEKFKVLYEKYEWAIVPLKKLFSLVCP
jgi:chromosome segregation ATPase